jgi:hypothetical protein
LKLLLIACPKAFLVVQCAYLVQNYLTKPDSTLEISGFLNYDCGTAKKMKMKK